ncbi:MAG: succinate dehydrogenase, cytochrome b556 subunit [Alphaproteobacteria bacterium]
MSETQPQKTERPLSPFMLGTLYRFQLTSFTSILHRATGVALTVGLLMFAWWLVAAAIGPGPYDVFMNFAGSAPGMLLLFGFTVAFYYHLANGIRHLIWDTGLLFKIENAYRAGYAVLLFTAVLTAITWYCVLMKAGI